MHPKGSDNDDDDDGTLMQCTANVEGGVGYGSPDESLQCNGGPNDTFQVDISKSAFRFRTISSADDEGAAVQCKCTRTHTVGESAENG